MLTELNFSFPGRIFRSPMPFSKFDLADVWTAYQEENVDLVVILTEMQEYLVYARRDLPEFYSLHGLDVLQIPVPDFGIPVDRVQWEAGIDGVISSAKEGRNVAIHCLAGLGRTGTFLACLAKKALGKSGTDAISWVRQYIPGAMENALQEEFVIDFPTAGDL